MRHNTGKVRFDLLTPFPVEAEAKVLTRGAEKYAPRNWERGMPFSTVLASLKRHLWAFESGEDYDPESGELHLAHVKCNASFLLEYCRTHPEEDDRDLWFRRPLKRVWLDIDGVLGDLERHFLAYLNLPAHSPTDWNDTRFRKNLPLVAEDREFWMSLPSLVDSSDITYPITGYCTSRPAKDEWTIDWLEARGFPHGEFINVNGGSKAEALKGICDVFLDDSIFNFMDLQRAGILCFLMTRPHNVKYNVGMYRVGSVSEFLEKVRCLGE